MEKRAIRIEWIGRGWGVGPKVLTNGVRVDI